jgi:type IV secretory pathway VirB10-like protein
MSSDAGRSSHRQYDSSVAFGQNRVLLAWTRLIMPNGTSIVLEQQPGADTQGYAGLEDEVDNHWATLIKAAMLSTLISVGAEAGTSLSKSASNCQRPCIAISSPMPKCSQERQVRPSPIPLS